MKTACNVCGNASFEERLIDDIYENPTGEKFVIENIPVSVCTVCGERTLSLAVTRHIFELLDAKTQIVKTIPVLEYV